MQRTAPAHLADHNLHPPVRRRRGSDPGASASGGPPPTVLFVDDDPQLLLGLALSVRAEYGATIALGAEDAIGAIQMLGPPTIVVTDLRMPGMDGTRFLDYIRERFPNSVRIVLTGGADVGEAERLVAEGHVFRFLTKPCFTETILGALAEAVAHAARPPVPPAGLLGPLPGTVENG
jgi:DNA-binding NtrC family response regulator